MQHRMYLFKNRKKMTKCTFKIGETLVTVESATPSELAEVTKQFLEQGLIARNESNSNRETETSGDTKSVLEKVDNLCSFKDEVKEKINSMLTGNPTNETLQGVLDYIDGIEKKNPVDKAFRLARNNAERLSEGQVRLVKAKAIELRNFLQSDVAALKKNINKQLNNK